MAAHGIGHPGEAVTGKVHEALAVAQLEEVDELRPPGRLAGSRKLSPVDDDIDRARFARVRTTRDRDLRSLVRNELRPGVGALQESGFRVLRHRGCGLCNPCIIRGRRIHGPRPGGPDYTHVEFDSGGRGQRQEVTVRQYE